MKHTINNRTERRLEKQAIHEAIYGDLEIKDINDYMGALGKFEKGQTVPVKVKRKNEMLTLSVTF